MAATEDYIKELKEKEYEALVNSVEKVIVIAAHTLADPDVWHISISKKTLEIRTSKLDSPTSFRQQYLKVFRKPAPGVLREKWYDFVTLLGEMSEDGTDEEDTETYIIEELMANLSQLELTSDREMWITGGGTHLLKNDGCLCVPSNAIRELLADLNIKCDVGRIGKIMTTRGIKLPKTPKISVVGQKQRVWRFSVEKINEYRENPIILGGDKND